MEKVRTQAERLEQLEGYKNLVEARLSELGHPVPVQAAHLGKPLGGAKPPSQETRLLQVSQENMYLKRRNEKGFIDLTCGVIAARASLDVNARGLHCIQGGPHFPAPDTPVLGRLP